MTDTKKVRKVLEILRSFSESEWEALEEAISKKDLPVAVEDSTEPKELSYEEKEKIVVKLLRRIGIPSNIKGYHCLRIGTILIMDNPEMINTITKQLYPIIAKKMDSTPSRVERAIRHAIEVAWSGERCNMELQNEIFGWSISSEKGKPTNSEALSAFAEYIKLYML